MPKTTNTGRIGNPRLRLIIFRAQSIADVQEQVNTWMAIERDIHFLGQPRGIDTISGKFCVLSIYYWDVQ